MPGLATQSQTRPSRSNCDPLSLTWCALVSLVPYPFPVPTAFLLSRCSREMAPPAPADAPFDLFGDLPVPILAEVLKHFSLKERLCSLAVVSKAWKEAALAATTSVVLVATPAKYVGDPWSHLAAHNVTGTTCDRTPPGMVAVQ